MSAEFSMATPFEHDPSLPKVPLNSNTLPSQSVVFVSLAGTFTFLATISVAIRFLSRLRMSKCWWDDWTILAALIGAYGFLLTIILGVTVGRGGYHVSQYSLQQMETYLKIVLANYALYSLNITLSKISIALFLRRVFGRERWVVVGTSIIGGLLLIYFFVAMGFLLFACSPMQGSWRPWTPSKCIHFKVFWISMAAFNIVLDIALLVLPQLSLWKLQLSRQKRVMISMIFVLGGLVCIASIIRIWYLARINMSDLTYTLVAPGLWTIIETDLSIICACLPMFPALFRPNSDGATPRQKRSPGASNSTFNSAQRNEKGSKFFNGLQPPRVDTTITVTHGNHSGMTPFEPCSSGSVNIQAEPPDYMLKNGQYGRAISIG